MLNISVKEKNRISQFSIETFSILRDMLKIYVNKKREFPNFRLKHF